MTKSLDLLIIKPGDQKKIYGSLSNSLTAIEPPLWAGLIASYIRDLKYSVKIIDTEAEELIPKEAANKAEQSDPFLIMFVVLGNNLSASTQNMVTTSEFIKEFKKKFPKSKTILWGLHPSALPERTLREEKVDFVCEGEGFFTIENLLKTLKTKSYDYHKVKGLWYFNNHHLMSNPRAPLIKNLNNLPSPAWDLLPMEKYRAHNWHCFYKDKLRKPYGVIYTSLGCPFNCEFCALKALFGQSNIRFRSPKKVIEDIDILVKKYHVKNIKILDECFILNENHVMSICDLIIERGYELNIWAYARVDTIKERMLVKMKKAGINWLGLGFESGEQEIRKGVNKGNFNNSKLEHVVKIIHNAGIFIGGNFIFGLPNDDFKTMNKTLRLAKDLNCEFSNFNVAMAYPGSKLYDIAIKKRVELPESWLGYSQSNYETHPLPTKYLTSAEVLNFRDKAFKEFYTSKKYLSMVEKKFNRQAAVHIKNMTKKKITRKLLNNN